MGLVTCYDCGEEVSNNSESCAFCGAPVKRSFKIHGYLAASVFVNVLLLMCIVFMDISPRSSGDGQSSPAMSVDKQESEFFIDELIKKKIFYSVQLENGTPHVSVLPLYDSLYKDTRILLLDMIYNYFNSLDQKQQSVKLKHDYNGKVFGRYHPQQGGLVLY